MPDINKNPLYMKDLLTRLRDKFSPKMEARPEGSRVTENATIPNFLNKKQQKKAISLYAGNIMNMINQDDPTILLEENDTQKNQVVEKVTGQEGSDEKTTVKSSTNPGTPTQANDLITQMGELDEKADYVDYAKLADAFGSMAAALTTKPGDPYKAPTFSLMDIPSTVERDRNMLDRAIAGESAKLRRQMTEMGVVGGASAITANALKAKGEGEAQISEKELQRRMTQEKINTEIMNNQAAAEAEVFNKNIDKVIAENLGTSKMIQASKNSLAGTAGLMLQRKLDKAKLEHLLSKGVDPNSLYGYPRGFSRTGYSQNYNQNYNVNNNAGLTY